MKKVITLLFICLMTSNASFADKSSIIVHTVEAKFQDIKESLRSAILGKGISVSHVLEASDMLNRTGKDFGYKNNVYSNASTFEFCSARISQKLARINPDNIVLCPFTISIYVLTKEPDVVRLTYQAPVGKTGTEEVIKEVISLIEEIIEEATF